MQKIKLSKRNLGYLITLLILLAGIVQQLFKPQQPNKIQVKQTTSLIASSSAQLVNVSKVIDGDTIELEDGQKVRYIGIDTPELRHAKKSVRCFGREARDRNKELVEGKLVRLEKDISETDRYWRLLRYVYVPTEASPSGLFVNEFLVREGYAYASTFPPDVKYTVNFNTLQKEAQINQLGLWNKCK